jgi:hypothetical protein
MTLVAASDAPKLVDALEAAGARILGMEGFDLVGQAIIPDMDAILDLSSVADVAQSATEARLFIVDTFRPDIYYEFDVDGTTA